jgi:hypothetical protein
MGARAQFIRLWRSNSGGKDAEGSGTGPAENKFPKCGVFFDARKRHKNHHVYHASHHTFTIKKPRSAPPFLQNPL